MAVVRDWDHFAELVGASAKSGSISSELPSADKDLVAVGYESWSAVRPSSARRRTLDVFESVLKDLYGASIASPYRKVKGQISPRGDELERLLAGILAESDGSGLEHGAAKKLAAGLAKLYLNRRPDIVDSKADGWLFASEARLVHGPNDHTRDETFRELMSNRLFAVDRILREQGMEEPEKCALPLTIWAVDVTEFSSGNVSPEHAHETRKELMVLASALAHSLDHELYPPREKPSLEFSSKRAIFSQDLQMLLSADGNIREDDLRKLLVDTSLICLIGSPPAGASQVKSNVDNAIFRQALRPATFIEARRNDDSPDKEKIEAIATQINPRQICFGARISFGEIQKISAVVDDEYSVGLVEQFASREGSLDPQFYIYHYEPKAGDRNKAVSEVLLQRFDTPPLIRLALFAILCTATIKLRDPPGQAPPKQATVGQKMRDLLENNNLRLLNLDEFFDMKNWVNLPENLFKTANKTDEKD